MRPGETVTAQDFNYRTPWPCTEGYYSLGEAYVYREWYYDHQGYGFNNFDHVQRQVEFERVKTGVR